jgi:membrane protein CcdC involved in cytochrome C biogenesis
MDVQMLTAGDLGFNNQSYVVLIFIALILLLQLRERRVSWLSLMIMPVFMLLLTVEVVSTELSSGIVNLLLIAVGLAIGIAIGVVIATRMVVKIDEQGRMVLKGSTVAVLLWAAIIVLKLYGKSLLAGFGLIDVGILTSIFLAMTLGAVVSRRAYLYWQYRRKKDLALNTV